MSTVIEALVRRGILERFYRDGNRKTIHLRLLPAAWEIARRGQAIQQQYSELLVADFSPEEKALLDGFLDRIARNVNHALAKQDMAED